MRRGSFCPKDNFLLGRSRPPDPPPPTLIKRDCFYDNEGERRVCNGEQKYCYCFVLVPNSRLQSFRVELFCGSQAKVVIELQRESMDSYQQQQEKLPTIILSR